MQAEQSRIETRLKKVHESYWDGDIAKGFYDKNIKEYTHQKELILEKINSLNSANLDYYSTIEKIVNICKSAPQTFESSEIKERSELITLVLHNLELDGDLLRWKYKKPFDLMASCTKMNSWLGIRDDYRTLIGVDEIDIATKDINKYDIEISIQ